MKGLPAGRYRFHHRWSGASSLGVDLEAGETSPELVLDLRAQDIVTGRIELPDGVRLDRTLRVRVEGANGYVAEGGKETLGTMILPDLRFRAAVPRGETVTLSVLHPALVLDVATPPIEVNGAREGIVFRMVQGAVARFRLTSERGSAKGTVRLHDGAVVGAPTAACPAVIRNGVLTFTGFPSGTFTAVIDVPGHVPRVVEGVVLSLDHENALGTLDLQGGSLLRVARSGPETVRVDLSYRGTPRFKRVAIGGGGRPVELRGLPAGEYEVKVAVFGVSAEPVTHRLEADGVSDLLLDLDAD